MLKKQTDKRDELNAAKEEEFHDAMAVEVADGIGIEEAFESIGADKNVVEDLSFTVFRDRSAPRVNKAFSAV